MTDFNDYTFDMDNGKLTPEQIEQLLQGKTDASHLTGAAKHLAELVAASKSPGSVDELAHETSVVSNFKAALGQASVTPLNPKRKRKVYSKLLTAKLAGAALAATALSGTAVAAYRGDLPSSIQSNLSGSLSKVGINIPSSNTSNSIILPKQISSASTTTTGAPAKASAGSQNGLTNGAAEGLANGDSIYGLCTAYLNSSSTTTSQPTTTTTTPSSTSTTSSALTAINLASTSSSTSTTSASTSTSSASSSTVSGSVAYQRLQAYAQKAGESVSKLCSTATHRTNADSTHDQGFGNSQATSHSNGNVDSHSPFSSSSTTTRSNDSSNSLTTNPKGSSSHTHTQQSFGNATSSNGNSNPSDNGWKGLSHNPFG